MRSTRNTSSFNLAAVLAASLCLPGMVLAQDLPASQDSSASVIGRVIAGSTGAGLQGATVSIEGAGTIAITRPDGTFEVRDVPAGTRLVEVEQFGFATASETLTVPPTGTIETEIVLEESAIDVDPIVVTATLDGRTSSEALRPTTALGGRELERRLSVTIAETLAGEPGVSTASMGSAPSRPVIRGFGGDRILILEDGERIGDVSSTSADHAVATEGSSAQQIEVVRGPATLFYGSNALGGVVNVVREEIPRAPVDRPAGRVSVQGQSVYAGGSGSGELVAPIGGLIARGEASYRRSGDTRTPQGTLANSDLRSFSAAAALSAAGSWGHAGLGVRAYASDYGIPPDSVSGHPSGVGIELERMSIRGSAELSSFFGVFDHVEASAGLTTYEHQEIESSGAVGTAFDQTSYYLELEGHHEELGPFGSGGIGVRAELRDYFSDNGRDLVDARETSFSVFGLEEVGRDPLTVQAGVRFDHRSIEPRIPITVTGIVAERRSFASVAASLAGLYELAEDVRMGISLARSTRTPSVEELFSQGPHLATYTFEVGNPRLEMETGLGADVFIRVNQPRLRAELVAFTSRIRDFSYSENTGEQRGALYVYRAANTEARYSGAEALVDWSMRGGWALGANASWVMATDIRADEPLPQIPPLQGRAFARYEREAWFAEGSIRWAARQGRLPDRPELPANSPGYCDDPSAGEICRTVPGEFLPTEGHAVLGATGGYRWILDRAVHSVTLRLENLTNRTYRNHLSRLKELAPEPGIGASLTYRLTF